MPVYTVADATPHTPPPRLQTYACKQTTDSDLAKLFGADAQIAYGFGSVFDEVRRSCWSSLASLVEPSALVQHRASPLGPAL